MATVWVVSRLGEKHCVKSVRIRSFSAPYFPAFRPNTERYSTSLRIQSECLENTDQKISKYGHFSRSERVYEMVLHQVILSRVGRKKIAKKRLTTSWVFTNLFRLIRITCSYSHCVKSVQIRSFFWSVFSCIRAEYRKILTRKYSVLGHFSRSVGLSNLKLLKSEKVMLALLATTHFLFLSVGRWYNTHVSSSCSFLLGSRKPYF